MGIFSSLGSVFGPVGTAIGGVVDGVAGYKSQKSQARRQNALEMQKFVRLRQAADAGGFHPLEALRSGQSVGATAGPRLFSSLAQGNAFDALENEITGEGAKERNRQSVEDEIRERELENIKIVNQQMTTPTIQTNRPPRLGGAVVGGTPKVPSEPLAPTGFSGRNAFNRTGTSSDNLEAVSVFSTTGLTEVDQQDPLSDPLLKPKTHPDGFVTYWPEDMGEFAGHMVSRIPAQISIDHVRNQRNATEADAQTIRDNFLRNNPEMSFSQIEKEIYRMTGGKFGSK